MAATVLMAVVVPWEIGEAQVRAWVANPALQLAAIQMLSALDGIWITLAAINTYLFLARTEGLATARRWTLLILLGSGVAAWMGARTGFPFGPIAFTDNLGVRIGRTLPIFLPLLWFIVVLNSRYVALRAFPRASHWRIAFGTAALAVLTDINLEPVAWKMRAWWLWYPLSASASAWPPLQNYASWFALSLALTGLLRETRVVTLRGPALRPVAIFAMINGVFLLANAVRVYR